MNKIESDLILKVEFKKKSSKKINDQKMEEGESNNDLDIEIEAIMTVSVHVFEDWDNEEDEIYNDLKTKDIFLE